MFYLKQVLSTHFLKQLADSTARGIARRDCFYDQFHYVNRQFVAQHFQQLAGLVVNAIGELHPGITVDDLTYVNDFVAPVNLSNAQIHTPHVNNRYDWHSDGIDRVFRPCYNIWIPLYRNSALRNLEEISLFDVLTPAACPRLYDVDGNLKTSALWSVDEFMTLDRASVSKLMSMPVNELNDYMYFHDGKKIGKIARTELSPISVVRPALGDCYVFNSSHLHATGPSTFERVGISIKFVIHNPRFGFRVLPHFSFPLEWFGMFVSWYDQTGSFAAYEEVLDTYILCEQPLLEQNATKLECVRGLLLEVASELEAATRAQ